MPAGPKIGSGDPGAGARPRGASTGLAGPTSAIQASAVICGGMISSSTNRKPMVSRPLRSVRAVSSANPPPSSAASAVEPRPVNSVWTSARTVSGERSAATAPPPAGA